MATDNPLDKLPPGLRQRLMAAQFEYMRAQRRLADVHDKLEDAEAELARTREALTWAMDEIDELANVACGFAYPQAMTIIGRKSQSDAYFAACAARRAALAKKEHTT